MTGVVCIKLFGSLPHSLLVVILDDMLIRTCLTARDIQAWDYVPLGPFLGKSFGKKLKVLLHWK